MQIGAIEEGEKSPVEQFPKLFTGLGRLEGDYSIQLREDAKPFALSVPLRVVIPLKDQVREELDRMEQLGVIAIDSSAATDSSEACGCSGVFYKLDANSGFWQIPLSAESSLLTTSITQFCRYAFNHLPFGITSTPEHFQRRMFKILSGLKGVVCMMDGILIHGKTQLNRACERFSERTTNRWSPSLARRLTAL